MRPHKEISYILIRKNPFHAGMDIEKIRLKGAAEKIGCSFLLLNL
jgi:hypothetical protein